MKGIQANHGTDYGASATHPESFTGRTETARGVLDEELEDFSQSIIAAVEEDSVTETPNSGGTGSSGDVVTGSSEVVPPPPPPHLTARNIESKRMEARRRDHCIPSQPLLS